MDDASRPEEDFERAEREGIQYNKVQLDTRLDNRVLDLRVSCPSHLRDRTGDAAQTQTTQAIFTNEHGVCNMFRSYLNSQGFTEIHTPKLQGAATESGASVFRVQYFNGVSGHSAHLRDSINVFQVWRFWLRVLSYLSRWL
jgi:aspartyl-tRNA synthetase